MLPMAVVDAVARPEAQCSLHVRLHVQGAAFSDTLNGVLAAFGHASVSASPT